MTKLVQFPLEEGGSIVVEVEEEQLSGPVPAASPGDLAGEAKMSFDEATAKLGPIARIVLDQVKDLGPQEIGVELGIKFSAEAGIILAKTSAEGTCTVKLTWKKPS
jgi:Trypsin-co-occurring domain 1